MCPVIGCQNLVKRWEISQTARLLERYPKRYQAIPQAMPKLLQYFSVLQSTTATPVLLCTAKYYSVLLRTTKYYASTPYYKVLHQYYSVLQSTTLYYKVLLRTTKYYASTTPYYKVLLRTTKYYSSTTPYYKVLL